MKEQLAPLHFNQPMVKQAPVLLTVCADVRRFSKWCSLRNADAAYDNLLWFVSATIDAMLFAQNICVAAEENGLGICYLGTTLYNAPEMCAVLKLPEGVLPITAITLGYPDEMPAQSDRLPLDGIIHHETYQDYPDETLERLFWEKEALESSAKFVAENKKENLAQVYTDVRYKRKDNLFFSEKLLGALRSQGFIAGGDL